jgi:short-subunit dehydrogenase
MTQVALITGASSGIGQAIAQELAQRGFSIALVARRSEELHRVADTLTRYAKRTVVCVADVSQPSAREQLLAEVHSKLGPVSCLVHSAAALSRGELRYRDREVSPTVATNLLAPIELTRLTLDDLAETRGAVVFLASTAGLVAFPYTSLYCATKHGLVGFAESIRHELKAQGIHVMVAYPPMTDTQMTRPMAEAVGYASRRMARTDDVGKRLVAALMARRRTYWGSWTDRLLAGLQRLAPHCVSRVLY